MERLFHRQIHPSFVHDGVPSSQAYKPTPKDNGCLSVYDGRTFEAKASYEHYIQGGYVSAGVMSLTDQEITGTGLTVEVDDKPFPGHAYIDYRSKKKNSEIEKAAKLLKRLASSRGWTYQP